MIEPKKVNPEDIAFGPRSINDFLPPMDEIPEEFKRFGSCATKWNKIVDDFFFSGAENIKLFPKKGVDSKIAFNHIICCLRSFEPPHEHKSAGCAYLMSLWFEDIQYSIPKKKK